MYVCLYVLYVFLSHTVQHQHISTTIMIVIRNIGNPSSLSKCITKTPEVTKNALKFLYSR